MHLPRLDYCKETIYLQLSFNKYVPNIWEYLIYNDESTLTIDSFIKKYYIYNTFINFNDIG